MRNIQNVPEAFVEMQEIFEWLKSPRTIKEFINKLGLGRVSGRNWIDGWCERGWIQPAGFSRRERGRPAMSFVTASPPVSIGEMLKWKYTPKAVERVVDPWAFGAERRAYFSEPRSTLDLRQDEQISWPTAKTHLSRWIDEGFLFDAGVRRTGKAPPAQLYCSDEARARRAVLESASAEYQRWRAKHPDADLNTWGR